MICSTGCYNRINLSSRRIRRPTAHRSLTDTNRWRKKCAFRWWTHKSEASWPLAPLAAPVYNSQRSFIATEPHSSPPPAASRRWPHTALSWSSWALPCCSIDLFRFFFVCGAPCGLCRSCTFHQQRVHSPSRRLPPSPPQSKVCVLYFPQRTAPLPSPWTSSNRTIHHRSWQPPSLCTNYHSTARRTNSLKFQFSFTLTIAVKSRR